MLEKKLLKQQYEGIENRHSKIFVDTLSQEVCVMIVFIQRNLLASYQTRQQNNQEKKKKKKGRKKHNTTSKLKSKSKL
ncbi:hypothetical protein RFI_24834 [Reticulomyxa filosa]|uniref:Uncharacterized protein n=1 Tax=Reticulomyxa filosa TaxID=46433 RepID=X6MGK1_RETFI|nr:hypothetical protein RFI_24834 [Reticulomyxa filosa]|eukprot:ETO12542.1 hypothetical protein RFI_24834 [Reticulomyxa filosa]